MPFSSSLNFLTFNARSVCSSDKIRHLRDILDSSCYDVILIQETWLSGTLPSSVFTCSSDYVMFRADREERSGGGVASLVKTKLRPKLVRTPSAIEIVCFDIELSNTTFRIINCYRAPKSLSSQLSLEHCKDLCNCISSLSSGTQIKLCIGDFNFPELAGCFDPSTATSEMPTLFLNTTDFLSYEQCNSIPSRRSTSNILDLVFIERHSRHLLSNLARLEPFSGSDHFSLSFSLACPKLKPVPSASRPNFRKADFEACRNYLRNVDWAFLLSHSNDIDEFYSHFQAACHRAIEAYVPLSKCTSKSRRPSSNPVLRRLRAKKRAAFKLYRSDPLSYKLSCQRYSRALKSHFARQEDALLSGSDLSGLFRLVRERAGGDSGLGDLEEGGVAISSPSDRANLFSEQFASVYTVDAGPTPFCPLRAPARLSNIPTFPFHVQKALRRLKSKTSRGPDGIPAIFLKQCSKELADPLSIIFSWSLQSGECPSIWKKAIVTPVYKRKGSRLDKGNYRPIGNCCASAKTLEKIVTFFVMQHLVSYNLLAPQQFGFLPKRSTVSQLLVSANDWTKLIDSKKHCHIIYLDYAKAFDSLSHSKLLSKLYSFGLSGNLLSWIKCYFTDRTQRVVVDGHLSSSKAVSSGILQGSCLGPLLFVMFINDLISDLNSKFENVKCQGFADDLRLYSEDPFSLQLALNYVSDWSSSWQLKLSTAKCEYLQLRLSSMPPSLASFSIDGTTLPQVSSYKDLGVHVDENLSFSQHITQTASKCRRISGVILKCFSSSRPQPLLQAFMTYVRPRLEYGSQVYSSCNRGQLLKLEKVQRFFTKAILSRLGKGHLSYEQRLRFLNLESFVGRLSKLDIVLAHKIYHEHTFCPGVLRKKEPTRELKHKARLVKEPHTSKSRTNFFANRVVSTWNDLPDSVLLSSPSELSNFLQLH